MLAKCVNMPAKAIFHEKPTRGPCKMSVTPEYAIG